MSFLNRENKHKGFAEKLVEAVIMMIVFCLGCGSVMGEQKLPVVAKKKSGLEKIIIDHVHLNGDSIKQAIDFTWARAVELDPTSSKPEEKGVMISLRLASGEVYPKLRVGERPQKPGKVFTTGKINYDAEKITLVALLCELAKQLGLDLYTTSVGVVYCPPGDSPFPNALAAKGEIWEKLYDSKTNKISPPDDDVSFPVSSP